MLIEVMVSQLLSALRSTKEHIEQCCETVEAPGSTKILSNYAQQLNKLEEEISTRIHRVIEEETEHHMRKYGEAELMYNNILR